MAASDLSGSSTDTSETAVTQTATSGQPTFIVGVPYQGTPRKGSKSTPVPAYSEALRMGGWDQTVELGLVDGTGAPLITQQGTAGITGPSDLTASTGVLIYSAEQVTTHAPTVRSVATDSSVQWGTQKSTITTNGGGDVIAYSFTGNDFTANYQNLAAVTMTTGSSNSLVAGNSMQAWTGLSAGTGLGLSASSTFGPTVNTTGGWNVSSSNGGFSVGGLGLAAVTMANNQYATQSIRLSVNPTKERSLIQARAWARYGKGLAIALAAAGATFALSAPIAADIAGRTLLGKLKENEDLLSKLAKDQLDFVGGLFPAIVVVQAANLLIGMRLLAHSASDMDVGAAGALSLGIAESKLSQGNMASLTMTETGRLTARAGSVVRLDAGEQVRIVSGEPAGPAVVVGPDEILLYVNPDSAISITQDGVRIHGPLTATLVPPVVVPDPEPPAPIDPLAAFGAAPPPPG